MGKVDQGIFDAMDKLEKEGLLYPSDFVPAAEEIGRPMYYPSGATRDNEDGKLDYAGALSPEVLKSFVLYMEKHRTLGDGSLRKMDDWKQGMPDDRLLRSLLRHAFCVWEHNGHNLDDLHGVMFNVMALIYNRVKRKA